MMFASPRGSHSDTGHVHLVPDGKEMVTALGRSGTPFGVCCRLAWRGAVYGGSGVGVVSPVSLEVSIGEFKAFPNQTDWCP